MLLRSLYCASVNDRKRASVFDHNAGTNWARRAIVPLEYAALICLEVIINGERRTVAGAASAETITAEVCTYPELQQSWLKVYGDVVPEDQPDADADWLSAQLSVGDQVQIQVIETDEPVAPQLTRIEPTAPASDGIPFVCAFCEKDAEETEGMLASRRAMICRSCVCYLYEMMHEDDGGKD